LSMRRTIRWAGLLVVLALVGPGFSADDKKKDDKQTKETITSSGHFKGTLNRVEGTSKNFVVTVTITELDPNKIQANRDHQARRTLEISRITDARERQRQTILLNADLQRRNLDIYKKTTKDVELTSDDNLKVRVQNPPAEFDSKGKPKKLSSKELKELKG